MIPRAVLRARRAGTRGRAAALLTCSALSLSSAFAPPPSAAAGGGSSQLDAWMRRERVGVYSAYAAAAPRAAASGGGGRAGDRRGGDRLNKLQELLVACEVVFDPVGGQLVAGEDELEGIAMRLDELTPGELGVPHAELSATESILYTEIAAGSKYTMCIFTLPAGAKLPLHDHPDMTVFSKVLWGEMAVSAYDRAPVASEELSGGAGGAGPEKARDVSGEGLMSWLGAKLKAPSAPALEPFPVIRRKDGEVWTADSGVQLTLASTCNMHEFTALSPCCVVDVLAPPYDRQTGRRCSYYQLLARPDDSLWARAIRCPSTFVTASHPYTGISPTLPDPASLR